MLGNTVTHPSGGIAQPKDLELNLDDDVQLDTDLVRSEILVNKSCSRKRLLRACCMVSICTLLVLVLIGIALLIFVRPPIPCSDSMSPPHMTNRNVGKELCVSHDDPTDVAKIALYLGQDVGNEGVPFVVIGDWGRDGFCCQRDVAFELNRMSKAIHARFVINTGDSFYENGILNATDEEVRTSFKDVYNQDYVSTLDWWTVLGNHDYRGSTRALMDLSTSEAPKFIIEEKWWSQVLDRPAPLPPVRFVMIDTSPMIDNYRTDDPDMHHSGGIDEEFPRVEAQMQWLESQLAIPGEMKIVIGHHPAFSYMFYGTENRTFLETKVVSLLERYNVIAYFAGHDHNLQYAQPRTKSTSYFVSGAGSRLRDSFVKAKAGDVHFYHVVHGFLACMIVGDSLRVVAVDMYGKMLSAVTVP